MLSLISNQNFPCYSLCLLSPVLSSCSSSEKSLDPRSLQPRPGDGGQQLDPSLTLLSSRLNKPHVSASPAFNTFFLKSSERNVSDFQCAYWVPPFSTSNQSSSGDNNWWNQSNNPTITNSSWWIQPCFWRAKEVFSPCFVEQEKEEEKLGKWMFFVPSILS